MKKVKIPPGPSEQRVAGKALRTRVSRSSQGTWRPASDRPDPIAILHASDQGRLSRLLPIRYGRMALSPFAFLRGSAAVMACDLAKTPVSGIRVQACGDAHLLNFGAFASPERQLLFDVNDFDETLPAPWEWDLKRLVASVAVGARYRGAARPLQTEAVRAAAQGYRHQLQELATLKTMDGWYAHISADELVAIAPNARLRKYAAMTEEKSHPHSARRSFPKMLLSGRDYPRFRDERPLVYHHRHDAGFASRMHHLLRDYGATLSEDHRALLARFVAVDMAVKVVGVGSVGTRCGVALLLAASDDPLVLQIKEARDSVLAPFAGKGAHAHQGQRVVAGQRLMQAASDIFLGWATDEEGRHFYVRQLRDLKAAVDLDALPPSRLPGYAALCGNALARSHARSGQAAQISGYLGRGSVFDRALAQFASRYADQTERDHAALQKAIRAGRIIAERGV